MHLIDEHLNDPDYGQAVIETLGRFADQVNSVVGVAASHLDQKRIQDSFARLVEDVTYLVDPDTRTYRSRLDQVLTRLTALEFQNAVVLDDVLVVLQRAEMTTRMAEEIERNCVELGEEGRLIRMQLDELMEDVPREKAAVVYDYEHTGDPASGAVVLERLSEMDYPRLLEFEELSELLGYAREVCFEEGIDDPIVAPDVYPATLLAANATRVFTGGGFNAMRQFGRDPRHRPLPFDRKFDDQYRRVARFRSM